MISRTWHGVVPMQHEEGFAQYLDETGVEEARKLPGNRGIFVERVQRDGYCHYFLCTYWDSWEDMAKYAGTNPSEAITYPEDKKYGLISDPIVVLQEVASCVNPFTRK